MSLLNIIANDILTQPAFLIGLMSMIGLIALRKSFNKILVGTLKPILGFLMLSAGADIIVSNLDPLGKMIESGFNLKGIIPNNEAIVSVAQTVLGRETMFIMVLGFAINILVARLTKYKYIFLTGHHTFFMACLLSAVLQTAGLSGTELILIGGFSLGAYSAISPAICQKYTLKVTDGDEVAMGHFGSLGYYLSAWVGKLVGKPEQSTEKIKIPDRWGFLRDTTISTALTMSFFYIIAALVAGPQVVDEFSDGMNYIIFSFLAALKFSVGVAVVYAGVRMILAELIPAFKGIALNVVPNAIPAVDCAVFFPYAPTAVIIGFVASFIGGLVGMFILGGIGAALIIPGLVPHFFCGATAGIYGNATGGRRGAIVGAFINGLAISFLPAMLLPVLGDLGFENTTFGDTDFGVIGILFGKASLVGKVGVYALVALFLLALIIPSFIKTKSPVLNNQYTEETE
ncbi:PTS ascorbate transporter subunit IIC [Numidum massiliense]|uniref:PTS ascorbate transporter subunit IIC n=1 Tax=Numidum massiliense TaxID=1522315 RepID=UPI0006D575AA|nr:PTS ascorbate transporter subunit IIC [Numidum massiliense]